jgi:hypothetical protein
VNISTLNSIVWYDSRLDATSEFIWRLNIMSPSCVARQIMAIVINGNSILYTNVSKLSIHFNPWEHISLEL